MYQLQQKTAELMKTSTDLKKDLKKQTKFNNKEIDTIFHNLVTRDFTKERENTH